MVEAITIASAGVIVASITAIIALVGILLSNSKIKESNEMLRQDLEHKLRPWIRIEGCEPTHAKFSDGEVVEWKNMPAKKRDTGLGVTFVKITATIINFGNAPCYMVSRFNRNPSMFERSVVVNDDVKKNKPVICMPQGNILKTMEVPAAIWDDISDNPFFVGVGIIYKLNDDTEVEMGKIWKMGFSGNLIEDDWYSEVKQSSLKIK